MYNIRTNCTKILEVIKDIIEDEINEKGDYLICGTQPKFSDFEVKSLSLPERCLNIDSENYLVTRLNKVCLNDFENLISIGNTMTVENYCLKKQRASAS